MAGKILLVDDEPDMLALLKSIIRGRTDHEVLVTNNPLEVCEIMAREPIDVLITDLKMPGLDGIELIGEIRKRGYDAVVLVITAFGSMESAEEAMAQGALDFITKPFRKERILLALDKAVRFRALEQQNRELKERLDRED